MRRLLSWVRSNPTNAGHVALEPLNGPPFLSRHADDHDEQNAIKSWMGVAETMGGPSAGFSETRASSNVAELNLKDATGMVTDRDAWIKLRPAPANVVAKWGLGRAIRHGLYSLLTYMNHILFKCFKRARLELAASFPWRRYVARSTPAGSEVFY